MDVVFVHGIRGGAFATWRREGVQNVQPGHKAGNLDHLYCWPSTWLPEDVPQARLLSMEYAAPASGWEVSQSFLHSLAHCDQCIPSSPAATCMPCPTQTIATRSRYVHDAFYFVAACILIFYTLYPITALLQPLRYCIACIMVKFYMLGGTFPDGIDLLAAQDLGTDQGF